MCGYVTAGRDSGGAGDKEGGEGEKTRQDKDAGKGLMMLNDWSGVNRGEDRGAIKIRGGAEGGGGGGGKQRSKGLGWGEGP